MMIYNEFLFKKGDEVICPSCRRTGFVNGDVLISEVKELIRCRKCGAYVKCGKLQKVNSREVEEC